MAKRFFSAVALHTRAISDRQVGEQFWHLSFSSLSFATHLEKWPSEKREKKFFFWPPLGGDVKNDRRCGWIRLRGSWETAITIVYWYWCDRAGISCAESASGVESCCWMLSLGFYVEILEKTYASIDFYQNFMMTFYFPVEMKSNCFTTRQNLSRQKNHNFWNFSTIAK